MSDETIENLLSKIATVLEEHNTIFLSHRQNFKHLHKEVGEIRKRLESLEATAPRPADAEFIEQMEARIKVLVDSLASNY